MRTHGEHIRILRRRVDFLKTRDHKNGYDQAELGALEWALVNLPPQSSKPWAGLTDEERDAMIGVTDLSGTYYYDDLYAVILLAEGKLREKNT